MPDHALDQSPRRARTIALRAALSVVALALIWVVASLALTGQLSLIAEDERLQLDLLLRLTLIVMLSGMVYVLTYHGQRRLEVTLAELDAHNVRYREIAELVGDFAYIIDVQPDGELRLIWATLGSLAALTGYPEADLADRASLIDLVHPDDRPVFVQRLELLRRGEPFEGEFRIVDASGQIHWIHDRARSVKAADHPRITRIYGSSHDVTERKQADLRLEASEQRWRQLADNTLDLVSETDRAGRYIYASRSHDALLGYKPEELIGRSVFDLIHPDDLPLAAAAYQAAIAHHRGGRLELRYRHQQGHYIWLETIGSVLFDAQDQFAGALFSSRDVTARKQAEASLSRYARRMSALYSAAIAVNTQPDLPTLFNTIIDSACELLQAPMGGLYLLDEQTQTLRLIANRPPDQVSITLQLGEGLAGRVAQSGQPLAVADYKHWEGRAPAFSEKNLGRILAVPLRLHDRIIGVLNVEDEAPGVFEEDDIRVVSLLADQAVVAVENRRLFERARQEIAERTRVEYALRESEARYRELVENAGEGIGFVDENEVFLDANPAADEVMGLGRGQLVGRSLREFTTPEEFEHVRQETVLRRAGQISVYEQGIVRADGEHREVLVTARPRFSPDGRFLGTFAVFRDITERKRAEEELRHTRNELARRNEQLTQILTAGNLLRLHLDINTALRTIVEGAHRSLGFGSVALNLVDVARGRVWLHSVIGFDDVTRPVLQNAEYDWDEVQKLMNDKFRRGRCYFIPAGELDWDKDFAGPSVNAVQQALPGADAWQPDDALFFPIELHDGEIVGLIWVDAPVDGRRPSDDTLRLLEIFANLAAIAIENARLYQAEQRYAAELEQRVAERTAELAAQSRRLQAILDSAGEGIQIMDRDGRVLYVNPAAERLTGFTAAEVVGHSTRFIAGNVSLQDRTLQDALLNGRSWSGVVADQRKDGTVYDSAITLTPLVDADGQVTGAVALCRDITPLKELERLKNQFVARIGHELRTPVANLKLYLDLLKRGKPERWPTYLATLASETDRLRRLIDSFLEMSQLDAGALLIRPTTFDLNQLLIDTREDVAPQAAERGLTLTVETAAALPPVTTDRSLIAQALARLLDNALKYTPPGGHIHLSTGVRDENGQHWVTLAVSDDGPGLSAEDQVHLYERFYRGEAARTFKVAGAGLGLPIAAAIMQQLEGRLMVDSRPGQGTTFILQLKARPPEAHETPGD